MTQLQPGTQQGAGENGEGGQGRRGRRQREMRRVKKNTNVAFVELPHLIIYMLCCTAERRL